MRPLAATLWVRHIGWLFIALGALGFASGVYADDRHRSRGRDSSDHYEQRHHLRKSGERHRAHANEHRHHRYAGAHHDHAPKHFHRKGWHYHSGRYWAPPSYRGRYCTDRRHYHGVHYHVAVRDYYDYYYPRYRYYGPHPHSGGASLIISVPLF